MVGAAPVSALEVQPLAEIPSSKRVDVNVEEATSQALAERPEIGERVVERDSARAEIRSAKSAFLPTVDFQGQGGEVRAYGRQDLLNDVYAGPLEEWNVNLNLKWELFDGGRRTRQLALAHAEEKRAQAEIDESRDQVEEQVYTAYIRVRTAFYPARCGAGAGGGFAGVVQCGAEELPAWAAQCGGRGAGAADAGAGVEL